MSLPPRQPRRPGRTPAPLTLRTDRLGRRQRLLSGRLGVRETPPGRGPEGRPLAGCLAQSVGNDPQCGGMVTNAEVARVNLDVLCEAGGLVQAGPPGDDAVQTRVDGGGWAGQWPEAGLQKQLERFG